MRYYKVSCLLPSLNLLPANFRIANF